MNEIIGKLYKANYTSGLYILPTKVMPKGKHYVYGILINFLVKGYGMDEIFVNTQVDRIEMFAPKGGNFNPSQDYRKIFPLVFRLKINLK